MKQKRPPEKKKRIGEGVGRAPEGVHAGGERGEVRVIMEGTRTVVGKGRDEDEDVDVALAAFEKKIDKTDPEQVKVGEEKKQAFHLSLSLCVMTHRGTKGTVYR